MILGKLECLGKVFHFPTLIMTIKDQTFTLKGQYSENCVRAAPALKLILQRNPSLPYAYELCTLGGGGEAQDLE